MKNTPVGDLLFGVHPVHQALVAGRRHVKKIYIAAHRKERATMPLSRLADQHDVPVEVVSAGFFNSRLRGMVHQGVAAEVGDLPFVDGETVLAVAKKAGVLPLILALDGIVDPQNLGSLVRSAKALGVHGVVLPKDRCAPLSAVTSKASAGAMEHMHFVRVPNMVSTLKGFKKQGCWVAGATASAGLPANQADLNGALVLVLGGEEKGIRPLVQKTCDFLISVPQVAEIDSLNAAVAGAIVMYEAMRQRRT